MGVTQSKGLKIRNQLPRSGWRLAALINTGLVSVSTILVLALLIWSTAQADGRVRTNTIIFTGACSHSSTINFWLHLGLNIFSTLILASSSFFCQVLSSPSRDEVDAVHAKDKALTIGISSLSNLVDVKRVKSISWAFIFFSSIPLHLFFNSAIFETEYQGAHWNLALASEGFAHEAQYFKPGTTLLPSGFRREPCIACDYALSSSGYGDYVSVEDYKDEGSKISEQIAATAASAAGWKRIEVPECRSQYEFCNARVTYGDVIMVVESRDKDRYMVNDTNLGWTRDSVLAPLDSLNAASWDPYVPAAESNSLWFFARCNTTAEISPQAHSTLGCFQTCNLAYGRSDRGSQTKAAEKIEPTYSFDFFEQADTNITLANRYWPGRIDAFASKLELKYCLAQEITPVCKVGLSNELLLFVLLSLIIKTTLCVTVTILLRHEDPLVVPGDAIVSFITRPDPNTIGECTLDRSLWGPVIVDDPVSPRSKKQGPRQWSLGYRHTWHRAIPSLIWLRSYVLFAVVIGFLGFVFGAAQVHNPYNGANQRISHSATNGILNTDGAKGDDLVSNVLLANSPQLLLSFSYFAYNSLFTILCVEKEWNSFSRRYRPVRVTDPKGQQISTYRLQLPYRYSIPLMAISAALHFLVSNTLYVFILEGGKKQIPFFSSKSLDLTFSSRILHD
ncbi:hypothetical protein F5Y19DRAFT_46670 [Xylariaceae sp. FL1651]|nr:hypothetical protein F5Y19DRAFT_46670 [Xylariaceae sp. FL1651]